MQDIITQYQVLKDIYLCILDIGRRFDKTYKNWLPCVSEVSLLSVISTCLFYQGVRTFYIVYFDSTFGKEIIG